MARTGRGRLRPSPRRLCAPGGWSSGGGWRGPWRATRPAPSSAWKRPGRSRTSSAAGSARLKRRRGSATTPRDSAPTPRTRSCSPRPRPTLPRPSRPARRCPRQNPWRPIAIAAGAQVALARGEIERAAGLATDAVAVMDLRMLEPSLFEILQVAARVLHAAGGEAWEHLRVRIRLDLDWVAERILDDDVRERWLAAPLHAELAELVGDVVVDARCRAPRARPSPRARPGRGGGVAVRGPRLDEPGDRRGARARARRSWRRTSRACSRSSA